MNFLYIYAIMHIIRVHSALKLRLSVVEYLAINQINAFSRIMHKIKSDLVLNFKENYT